jgi:hypothetical protein
MSTGTDVRDIEDASVVPVSTYVLQQSRRAWIDLATKPNFLFCGLFCELDCF